MRQSWLGVGVLTAGVGLQLLAGATAWADPDTASDTGPSAAAGDVGQHDAPARRPSAEHPSTPKGVDTQANPDMKKPKSGREPADADKTPADPAADDKAPVAETAPSADTTPEATAIDTLPPTAQPTPEAGTPEQPTVDVPGATVPDPAAVTAPARDRLTPRARHAERDADAGDVAPVAATPEAEGIERTETTPTATESAVSAVPATARTVVTLSTAGSDTPVRAESAKRTDTATESVMSAAAATSTVRGAITNVIGTIVGLVFSVISALERFVAGPARAPEGSTVTVHSSSLQLTDGLSVPADWYFPEVTEPGTAPERIVYFAHGFFGVGAMYSYTAARLAESTNSIVVVPTVTSNPLAADGLWINGAGLQPVVADLFTGNRAALTQSALAAGYAEQYGLSAQDAVLPHAFALAGHSAGGALVSGVISYLVDNGAVDDLAGVVLFDAVTSGSTLTDSLAKLDEYQQRTGRFIPVREIGSPKGLWNFPSTVNASLEAARPESFSGVVLRRGTHADSIQGGSWAIQFLVCVLVGKALPQNVDALNGLAATWLNAWFDGTDQELVPGSTVTGSTVTIPTPSGPATGAVIGATPDVTAADREQDLAIAV